MRTLQGLLVAAFVNHAGVGNTVFAIMNSIFAQSTKLAVPGNPSQHGWVDLAHDVAS